MMGNKVVTSWIILGLIFIFGVFLAAYKTPTDHKPASLAETVSVLQVAELTETDDNATTFHNALNFKVIGQLPNTEGFTRLPSIAENSVRERVWELSQHSAGVSVRFTTNSSTIKVRWEVKFNNSTSNMTSIVTKGLDLYAYTDNRWQFVNAARPSGDHMNEATIIDRMDTIPREYLLNLPTYDGIVSLEIGIDSDAFIANPAQHIIDTSNPIVFYGTSITQGSSASRPGLTYAALIQRHFNKDVINLGFSGNGRFEKEVAEFIMTADPSLIILDCTPNSSPHVIRRNLPETIDYITSVNDTVPIMLVESIMRDFAYFRKDDITVSGTISHINEQNNALREVYESKKLTRENLFYIHRDGLIGNDNEATIDGVHFNDLGNYRAFERIRQEIEKIMSR
jgi:hypothetical protein